MAQPPVFLTVQPEIVTWLPLDISMAFRAGGFHQQILEANVRYPIGFDRSLGH